MPEIYHALGLHMHQPPDNVQLLLDTNDWEARQILLCYERALKYAQYYPDVGRINIGFSGILLEQLTDPRIIDRCRSFLDIPKMLDGYRQAQNIEVLGMGFFHPIFPLIPQEDWEAQLVWGREKIKATLGKDPKGFWPPEMAFSMEMIPALKNSGYEYVIVDGVHVNPLGKLGKVNSIYRPHLAQYDDSEIVVIPRDRDISNAQESGFNPVWFKNEVLHKIDQNYPVSLVTTWSDGENGGWFRQMHEPSGFWGYYFAPYMDLVRSGQMPVKPTLLSDFILAHPPKVYAKVQTGAWNVGSTSGYDFSQWAGSQTQRQALEEVWSISKEYQQLSRHFMSGANRQGDNQTVNMLNEARYWLLRSETSCYFFWGDSWIPRVYENTRIAREKLDLVKQKQ
jgi:alpha-amylase/alpha-mannosidase (GH57 family)